jgi:hypothetical protein
MSTFAKFVLNASSWRLTRVLALASSASSYVAGNRKPSSEFSFGAPYVRRLKPDGALALASR